MKLHIHFLALCLFAASLPTAAAQDVFDLSDDLPPAEAVPAEAAEHPAAPAPTPPTPPVAPLQEADIFTIPLGAVEPEPIVHATHWALIICGHPGDEAHRTLYAASVELIYEGLTTNCGFEPGNIVVQFGSEILPEDGPALTASQGEATAEELAAQVAKLKGQISPNDTLWTIVLGHAYYDGRHSFLNLPGADVHQDDFAAWFEGMPGRQVFLITTPVSGYFVRPLSAENRFVITATPPDLEVNETLFHAALAEVLSEPPTREEFDMDADGKPTLLDFYLTLTRNIAQRYLDANLLATEHSVLDDNGDGRGLEIQIDYLTVEQGGRERGEDEPLPKIRPNSDGFRSQQFDFSMLTLSEPMEEPAEEEAVEEEPAETEESD